MTRAISSLPVPDSPWISTVAYDAETLPISFTSRCIGGLLPTMSPSRAPSFSTGTAAAWRESWRTFSARSTTRSSAAGSENGLWM